MRRKFLAVTAALLVSGIITGCAKESETIEEGMLLVQSLDYAGAMDTFVRAEEQMENPRLLARAKGIALMGQTRYEEAVNAFKESLSYSNGFLQPIDYDVNYYMATALIKMGKYEEAIQVYDAILALDEQTDAFFLRGVSFLALGDYQSAQADFDKVLTLEPRNFDRLISIYESLEEFGYKQAGQELLTAALAESGSSMTEYDRGRINFYLGEYSFAATALENARQSNSSADAFLYLGRTYEALGEFSYAASVYESYLATDDRNAVLYNQLGLCKMKVSDYKAALAAFQAGMQIEDNPVMQDLYYNEICAYEYMGEFQKAEVMMNDYLKNYPDDKDANREQIFLSTR